jgi:heterodisulfide reductase subunit B
MTTAAVTESRERTTDDPTVRTYAYYPGCTLYTKAKSLDRCARLAAERVGFRLEEMPSWVCCGAVYNTSADDFAGRIGAQRNVVRASALGDRLVTLCAACYNVLKRAQARLNDPANAVERRRVLEFLDEPYEREVRVLHYLDVLRTDIGWPALAEKVVKPLAGLKVASYYGCLMVRPAAVLDFDDPENPQAMDDLVRTLGGEPVGFDFKARRVLDNAKSWGAEAVVTTCPLCQYNLDKLRKPGKAGELPVLYFTQLLGLAVGMPKDELAFDANAVDPVPLLEQKGLL